MCPLRAKAMCYIPFQAPNIYPRSSLWNNTHQGLVERVNALVNIYTPM